ncbi:hypothetical protein E4U43_002115 [Claviceps pusilla]|uniref:C2H2-type domain-containing protein n=1 Tax=Claviceps pusilla TaxID=123648 RepID=A0A9P7N962_9HYPO|nr:hypothetical protein E4U43_002115 [Claviceps pusilla]
MTCASRASCDAPGSRLCPTRSCFTSDEQQDFLCSGELKSGGRWGCGRRFNWLHDFARHLKTPTGRKCIQPLYDEERQTRARCWTGSPISQQSDESDYSSFSAWPETFMPAQFPESHVPLQTQLQQFPFDFSFPATYYSDYDPDGSSQLQIETNLEDISASLSPVDAEPITLGATVPGISYMAWWQSYMGSISALSRVGDLQAA